MAHFDENSDEYLDNGHFNIDGIEFMSVWTYKSIHQLSNERKKNAEDSDALIAKKIDYHTCKPETGNYNTVCIFPFEELKKFYKN